MRPGQQGCDWFLSCTSFTVDCYSLSLSIIHDYLLWLTVIILLLIKTIDTGILCHVMGPKRCCRTVAFSPSAQTASVLLLGCGICGIMIMVGLVLENLDINYEYYYVYLCVFYPLPPPPNKNSINLWNMLKDRIGKTAQQSSVGSISNFWRSRSHLT